VDSTDLAKCFRITGSRLVQQASHIKRFRVHKRWIHAEHILKVNEKGKRCHPATLPESVDYYFMALPA
jgi:hypothetical protein